MSETRPVVWKKSSLKVLDQTLLPFQKKWIDCKDYKDVAAAIKDMKLRGAPLIGVSAAYGLALEARVLKAKDHAGFAAGMRRAAETLVRTRPTAVNLKWAVDRMMDFMDRQKAMPLPRLRKAMAAEAERIFDEDLENNRRMGRHGAALVPRGARILTHCNAGALATAGYGTALGVIRAAHAQGKKVSVFVDETRPYLQGARLTAFEMAEEGVPHELITDNMAGHFMSRGQVQCVIVGADRIAANGDTANKIGTYSLAVIAAANGIPFYVAAPLSTVDLSLATGAGIPIESRSEDEVKRVFGTPITAPRTRALHPAFDVTPARYVTAIITEKGVVRPPYGVNLRKLFADAPALAAR